MRNSPTTSSSSVAIGSLQALALPAPHGDRTLSVRRWRLGRLQGHFGQAASGRGMRAGLGRLPRCTRLGPRLTHVVVATEKEETRERESRGEESSERLSAKVSPFCFRSRLFRFSFASVSPLFPIVCHVRFHPFFVFSRFRRSRDTTREREREKERFRIERASRSVSPWICLWHEFGPPCRCVHVVRNPALVHVCCVRLSSFDVRILNEMRGRCEDFRQ